MELRPVLVKIVGRHPMVLYPVFTSACMQVWKNNNKGALGYKSA